jgi:hypothetical protein
MSSFSDEQNYIGFDELLDTIYEGSLDFSEPSSEDFDFKCDSDASTNSLMNMLTDEFEHFDFIGEEKRIEMLRAQPRFDSRYAEKMLKKLDIRARRRAYIPPIVRSVMPATIEASREVNSGGCFQCHAIQSPPPFLPIQSPTPDIFISENIDVNDFEEWDTLTESFTCMSGVRRIG